MMLRAWQLLLVIWLMLLLLPACQSFSLKTSSNHNDGRSRHIQEKERPNRNMSKKNYGESDNYATKTTPEKPKRRMKRRPQQNPRSPQQGSLDDDDQYDYAHDVKQGTATSSIKSLFTRIESYCSNQEDLELVQKAVNFTLQVRDSRSNESNKIDNKHTTKNNEGNIMQAIGTARVIAEMKLDVSSIIAGVLYSCFWSIGERDDDESETGVDLLFQQIHNEFGPSIEKLVTGVYKIDQAIDSGSGMTGDEFDDIQKKTEKYRKMIVAMAGDDIRILLIKLADQTHVVRTLLQQQQEQVEEQPHNNKKLQQHAKSIGRDTITLFAPLAHRLGLYTLKTELEELSFRLWKPDEFRQLRLMVSARKEQRQKYTNEVIRILEDRLNQEGIAVVGRDKDVDYGDTDLPTSSSSSLATVTGRAKSFYSIHQKIKSQKKRFDDIQDLIAFRILVKDISQCYEALGVVTSKFEPEPGRFKDYIAKPKPNGYQSIHSTVIGPEEKRIEVQIRTYDMHEAAENGVAAHFLYKDGAGGNAGGKKTSENDGEAKRYSMLRQLVEWIQTTNDDDKEETEASAKQKPAILTGNGDGGGGTLSDGVFVFSPQGQLFEITNGSSVLDFAYRIHSDLGNKCVGAKVDGKMVPLKYQLRNGETIEIIQSSTQTPRQEWLNFVQTSKAQSRIKSWLYKDERARQQQDIDTVSHGRQLLEKAITKHITSQQQKRRVQHHGADAFKVYKEKLNDILSKFKFNDEREFLICLSLGQISIASVIREICSTPGSRQITIPSASSISLLEDAFGNEVGDEVVLKSMEESETIRRPAKSDDGIVVGGKRNILVTFCRSCKPLFGEKIKGVVTQGRGVKIHRTDCKYLLESDEERCVNAAWDEAAKSTPRGATEVEVIFDYEPGILAGMTKTILSCKVNIGNVKIKRISDGRGLARFDLMLSTIDELNQITSQLLQEKGILFIKRR